MNKLLTGKIKDLLPALTDGLFVLFLITEWLFRHTALSQGVLLCFAAAMALLVFFEKKLYLNLWHLGLGLMILWGLVGLPTALSGSQALSMVKTLCINLVFLFLLYQYFILRGEKGRIQNLFMGAGVVFLLLVILLSCPEPFSTRLGMEAGVNPNEVATVAGTVFAFALCRAFGPMGSRAKGKQLLWILAFLPMMAVIFFTSSLKGYLLIFGIFCLYYLIRYPKNWGFKALILFLLCCGLLYVLTMENFLARWEWIYYRITYRLQKILEYLKGGARHRVLSIIERTNYFALGAEAIGERPFVGWGLDCFRFLEGSNGTYSHNNFIELLVSGGLPMLAAFYLPWVVGIVQSFRNPRRDQFESVLLALMLLQIPLDFAMVSYFERSSLVVPTLFFAAVSKNKGPRDWMPTVEKYVKNPYRVLAAIGSKGGLKFLPTKTYLKICYRGRVGKKLNLNNPTLFTEKLNWMKLYDKNPLYPTLADKLAVRSYVRNIAGDGVLVPLLGAWDRAEDVDFTALPDRFALKCTHDSGGVRVCTGQGDFDKTEAIRFLSDHLNRNYYWRGREWWYRKVPPKVIAEAYIGSPEGKLPDDYKFFCFDGQVKCLAFCTNRRKATADYYFLTRDYEMFPVNDRSRDCLKEGITLTPPACYEEMVALAEKLSKGIPQVRVDLYELEGKIYFGEMTLCDQCGFADDYVDDGDAVMGDFYTLPKV